MTTDRMMRRRFLAGAGVAGAALASSGLAAGCTTEDGPSGQVSDPTPQGAPTATLPTFKAFDLVQPDLPSDEFGTLPGYVAYPYPPQSFVDAPPGKGGTVTAVCQYGNAGVPPELSRNRLWQNLNEKLGVELDFNGAPTADYKAKFSTMLAGKDVPDLIQIPLGGMPRLPDLLEAQFEDLSEHLGGDKSLDHPALAAIDPAAWRSSTVNGRLYGLPLPRGSFRNGLLVRADWADKVGVSIEPTSADEFLEMCRGLTDHANNRWAIALADGMQLFVRQMFGVPNEWGVDDNGGFTHAWETDEQKQSLEFMAQLWSEELCHPDGFGAPQHTAWMGAATPSASLIYTGMGFWFSLSPETAPGLRMAGIRPPRADGSGWARGQLGDPTYSYTVVKKGSPERIQEILGIANYLAAPLGTVENLVRTEGVEGHHWNWQDEQPVRTEQGTEDRLLPTAYVVAGNATLYSSTNPDAVKDRHSFEHTMLSEDAEPLPTLGLYSETQLSEGPALASRMQDLINEIIQGRSKVSDWDAGVAEWRNGGGDQIRSEYETAHAQAQQS